MVRGKGLVISYINAGFLLTVIANQFLVKISTCLVMRQIILHFYLSTFCVVLANYVSKKAWQ